MTLISKSLGRGEWIAKAARSYGGKGKRFATMEESPLADQIKGAVSNPKPDGGATEDDTLYGKNFDNIPARVMRSPAVVRLNAAPAPFPHSFMINCIKCTLKRAIFIRNKCRGPP